MKQHKFWQGHIIADCESAVVETMRAAKARIEERKVAALHLDKREIKTFKRILEI